MTVAPRFLRGLWMLLILIVLACVLTPSGFGAVVNPTFADRYDYGSNGNGCDSYGNVAAGDINGDGIPDLVCNGLNAVFTMLGNGDGTFRTGPSSTLATLQEDSFVLLDLNGDGKMDLVATSTLVRSDRKV